LSEVCGQFISLTSVTSLSAESRSLSTATYDEITDISGTFTVYKYDLKGNSSFEQAFNSSRENGTTFFTQTLNLSLTKLTKAGQQSNSSCWPTAALTLS
jgi:hypothetical protein